MKLAENLSEKELRKIRHVIGEAFITNELFHEFGSIEERRPLVMRYMAAYVDSVYESKALYATDDGLGFIGLQYSKEAPVIPQLRLLFRLFMRLPFGKIRKLLRHIKQIASENKRYASKPHIDVLMVAVNQKAQGRGYATKLVNFAKEKAEQKRIAPI